MSVAIAPFDVKALTATIIAGQAFDSPGVGCALLNKVAEAENAFSERVKVFEGRHSYVATQGLTVKGVKALYRHDREALEAGTAALNAEGTLLKASIAACVGPVRTHVIECLANPAKDAPNLVGTLNGLRAMEAIEAHIDNRLLHAEWAHESLLELVSRR